MKQKSDEQKPDVYSPYIGKRYKTLAGQGEGRLEEKKSIFLSYAAPVSSEEEALDFLASIRAKHPTATHNVYAYHCVDEANTTYQRYSDDGEPSGTSGIPVLDSFRKKDLSNLIVVVTRYFGGVLLGASGLVRSYGKAASLALIDAGEIERIPSRRIHIALEYTFWGKLQNFFTETNTVVEDTQFLQNVQTTVILPLYEVDSFCEKVVNITNGTAQIENGDRLYYDY